MKFTQAIAIGVLAMGGFATGSVAIAAEPTQNAPVDPKNDPDKVVCKSEKMTGSRTKTRRICMTRAEWDNLASRTKRGMDDFNRSAAGGANSSFNTANLGGT